MMRLAVIDIGTNTILLLITDIRQQGIERIVRDEQVIARIGKGVDRHKAINQDTFSRATEFLLPYRSLCRELGVEKIVAVGTSALRDAENKSDFLNHILDKTGISVEILSGDEEARWTYIGGISEFEGRAKHFSVLDIGGGSTEIIVGNNTRIFVKQSFDIGCVRITERFLHSSPPTSEEIESARSFIDTHLDVSNINFPPAPFAIGVAGTLTTLAALHQRLSYYNPSKVTGYYLPRHAIEDMYHEIEKKSVEEIRSLPQVSSGRADIIFAGILIVREYLQRAAMEGITVSDRGLRYGITYREIRKNFGH